jgi:hypothetical protein
MRIGPDLHFGHFAVAGLRSFAINRFQDRSTLKTKMVATTCSARLCLAENVARRFAMDSTLKPLGWGLFERQALQIFPGGAATSLVALRVSTTRRAWRVMNGQS